MASALTVTRRKAPTEGEMKFVGGPGRFIFVDIAFSGTYPTGGESFDPNGLDAGLFPSNTAIEFVVLQHTATYEFSWDKTNKKVQAWVRATGAELGNGNSGLAGTTVRAQVFINVQ